MVCQGGAVLGLLLGAVGLGLAGFDPASVLIAAGLLAAGAPRGRVLAFCAVVLLLTPVLAIVLSLTAARAVLALPWSDVLPPPEVAAWVEVALGLVALRWAWVRWRRTPAGPEQPRRRRTGTAPVLLLAVGFTLSVVGDPAFVAYVVLAARESVVAVVLGAVLWTLAAQLPLAVLTVALVRGRTDRWVPRLQAWWDRARPVLAALLTALLVVVGVVLLADGLAYVLSGSFLLPGPR